MLIDANHLINLFHPGCSFLSFLLLTSPTYLVPQSVKCLPAMRKMEDLGLIPGLGRFPGEGNGTPLQYSCLEKSHGRRSLVQATIYGVAKSWAQLSDFT